VKALSGDLVVATGNAGKVRELTAIFADLPLRLRLQSEFDVVPAEETGCTFVENALLKARAASEQTGLPALADDSGIAVDALGGAPGVYSARYAGVSGDGADGANNRRLLEVLQDVPDTERGARFICALVLLRHADDPVPLIAQGEWRGRILHAPRGDGGFGYDPLFAVGDGDTSSAELPREEKNRISHRAIAAAELRRLIAAA
jgi:XTP/dITP diphosphohydrolase